MFFHLYTDANRHWRWTLYAGNNRKIANSGEGYFNKSDCLAAINLVKGSGSTPIIER
ncbi:YegP family protein [Rhizobium leguminosarum]|uniref:YegP family protein n=1 Tax=Rhizobium leguminosarum TaxID=384 RepID=UPI003F956B94